MPPAEVGKHHDSKLEQTARRRNSSQSASGKLGAVHHVNNLTPPEQSEPATFVPTRFATS